MKHIGNVVQSIQGCTTSTDSYGNLYVTKGDGPYKAMVCHTDTVHDIVKAKACLIPSLIFFFLNDIYRIMPIKNVIRLE